MGHRVRIVETRRTEGGLRREEQEYEPSFGQLSVRFLVGDQEYRVGVVNGSLRIEAPRRVLVALPATRPGAVTLAAAPWSAIADIQRELEEAERRTPPYAPQKETQDDER